MARKRKPQPTTVVNVKTAAPGSFVYVGRRMFRHADPVIRAGSIWGNPFKVGADGTVEEVLGKYRQHVLARPDLVAQLHTLRGQALACWCAPGPCHAYVLAELADSELGDPPAA